MRPLNEDTVVVLSQTPVTCKMFSALSELERGSWLCLPMNGETVTGSYLVADDQDSQADFYLETPRTQRL